MSGEGSRTDGGRVTGGEGRAVSGESTARRPGGRGRLGWLFEPRLATVAAVSLFIVVLAGLVQVSFGAYSMTVEQAWRAVLDPAVLLDPRWFLNFLLGEEPMRAVTGFRGELPELARETLVVWSIRLPRVLVAVVVGMNLAVSGAIFQAVTRNELASPFILGVSSGAGLTILLTLVVFGGLSAFLPLIAALGGSVAFLIVYAIAWKNGTSPVRLVLAGVIVGTVFNSLQTGLFFFADDIGVVQSAIQWTTGSLTGTDWEQVRTALPWTLVAVVLSLVGSRQLNLLLLGEQTAKSLGMSIERVRFALSGVAVLAAAASIAVAGIVSFVGLIVPHVVRNLVGSDYKRVIVGCLFVGPALMVGADVGARLGVSVLTGADAQIPVGIVTGLVGGPYFLYLMRRRQNVGEL
ncbi:iron ABC transporter permease [Halorubrum ezzemoulense]|uniref:Cobalamin import system permease protein BtuC n=3 Tax=Halorubrum TaxID=56688 RepID=A0A238V8P2_HALEZ|nr:iron ABC transporter permease [Halorubrum ezzemoulense]MDB2244945.1 iron ABC transporter permease [Halorubrum ezzemoulense]MDB2251152.1 iron ABC transporter permease [Halorubrum ezzemoulense]MDB2278298.1 iron ABC transporter permease [Halorubrum ezzemoulense]MDB2284972.1 iron ABC transporter permease [Halorubrum ezzemoulense]MDB2288280.1 iron ABC transporter permease [Halorubrum ezzemoulense]